MTDISNASASTRAINDSTEQRRTPLGLGHDRAAYTNPFDNAPFYRKRWMIVMTALVFIPVTLIILLTGPVYQNDGEVWDQKKRMTSALALACFMVFALTRVVLSPAQ